MTRTQLKNLFSPFHKKQRPDFFSLAKNASPLGYTTLIIGVFILGILAFGNSQAETGPEFKKWQSQREEIIDDPSVVAYYDFQDEEAVVLKNMSKHGDVLDGEITGATWGDGRWPGKKALIFDGASYVEIPENPLLCPLDRKNGGTGNMTIEVWMKATRMGTASIIDKSSRGTTVDAPYALWMAASRLCAYLGMMEDSGHPSTADADIMDKDEWTHVVVTINDDAISLYRNGLTAGNLKRNGVEITDNGKPLFIGATGKGLLMLNGVIDEVVIYNKVLSDAEIEQHAMNHATIPEDIGPPSVSLLAPSDGAEIRAGSWHRIRWQTNAIGKKASVKIDFSSDDGKNWKEVAPDAPDTGEYVWQVPESLSGPCRIRVGINGRDLTAQNGQAFTITRAETVPEYEWINVTMDAPFAPRDGLGTLSYAGRMWVLGGWNPNDKKHFPLICNNEVWSSEDGENWILDKPNTFLDKSFDPDKDWEGRHFCGYAVFKDKMWIIGGDANQGHYMDDVWNSSDGKSWTFVNQGNPVPWGPRALQYTLVFKDKIWVMGGQTMPEHASAEEKFYRDIWATSDGVEWKQVIPKEPFWPQRGMIGGNVVFKDRMWILGGGTYNTPEIPRRKFYNDVWSSPDGVHWECHVEKAPWEARQYHDVAVFDGRMWILEGYGPQNKPRNRNDVWHSKDGVNWYPLPNTPWGTRHAAGVFVHDNALWVIAGNNMQSDVWKLVRKN